MNTFGGGGAVTRMSQPPGARLAARVVARAGDAARACAEAYRDGGIAGLRRVVGDAAYWRFHPRVRRWNAELRHQQYVDEEFDREFGLDTAGETHLSDAGVPAWDVERGHGLYRPVWASVLREAVRCVPADLSRFTFIDYGSGKGKGLLLATDFPFEEIIGIEFAPVLHAVAARNIEIYSSSSQRCRRVRVECLDALHFVPPERPLVCFFFNPFDEATLGGVLDNLRDSFAKSPRDIYIAYTNMRDVEEHDVLLGSRPELESVVRNPRYLISRVTAGRRHGPNG